MNRTRATIILIIALTLWTTLAFAQESLQSAKDLYASAAYDDALGVLNRLRASQPQPERAAQPQSEIEQYRVLCFVALGRHAEAENAIQTVVKSNPAFVPDASEMSPRVRDLFTRTREQLLPEIVRQMYRESKGALERKDRAAALSGFDAVVRLIDSTGADPDSAMGELRFLAAGFLDLSRALPEPVSAPPPQAIAEPAKPSRAPEITPPVAVRQVMPQWIPSDTLGRQGSFTGTIRVSISAAGRVDHATIEQSVHPAYDRLLLQAAKSWEYQPARKDGTPVPSEQVVQVQLKPRQ